MMNELANKIATFLSDGYMESEAFKKILRGEARLIINIEGVPYKFKGEMVERDGKLMDYSLNAVTTFEAEELHASADVSRQDLVRKNADLEIAQQELEATVKSKNAQIREKEQEIKQLNDRINQFGPIESGETNKTDQGSPKINL